MSLCLKTMSGVYFEQKCNDYLFCMVNNTITFIIITFSNKT